MYKGAMQKIITYDLITSHYKNLLKEFTNYLKILGYSASTIQQLPTYTKEFLHCQERKGNTYITGITSADIQQHYEYLQTRPNQTRGGGLSSSMIASHLFALKIFFKWLEAAETLTHNPISNLNFPYPEYNYRTALTQQEITHLYEAAETPRDKAMLGLFYGCGLRRAEAESINTEDIRLKENTLIVREGKGCKRRVVPLAEQVKQDFENYYNHERPLYLSPNNNLSLSFSFGEGVRRTDEAERAGNEGAFMLNNKGRRMTRDSYTPRLKLLAKKAGIQQAVCLHQLRHSIATHLLEQGMSIEKVRDFLGHKYIDTTQKYTHVNQLKLF